MMMFATRKCCINQAARRPWFNPEVSDFARLIREWSSSLSSVNLTIYNYLFYYRCIQLLNLLFVCMIIWIWHFLSIFVDNKTTKKSRIGTFPKNAGPLNAASFMELWPHTKVLSSSRYLGRPLGKDDAPFRRWLGGGFKQFLFSPLLGEMIQID